MLRYYERAGERLAEMLARPARRRAPSASRPGSERAAAHALAKEPPKADRIAAWREQMSAEDVAAFEAVAGDLLAELGYQTGGSAVRCERRSPSPSSSA